MRSSSCLPVWQNYPLKSGTGSPRGNDWGPGANERGHHEERHSPRVRGHDRELRLRQQLHHAQHKTSGNIHVEICSNCHPFYTGKQKIMDTGGRVARFEARYGKRQKKADAK